MGSAGRWLWQYRAHGKPQYETLNLADGASRRDAQLLRDELLAAYRSKPSPLFASRGLTVNELADAYREYAQGYYLNSEGKSTSEINGVKSALGPLCELLGGMKAADFSPKRLAVESSHLFTQLGEICWRKLESRTSDGMICATILRRNLS